ncbi:unnamed protein product [Kluyveromyces dobzhanskii CBS 2104]|uniref:WGS project CCBQ000000000 data, contig 00015 n=1 Tax=Kluyveromyces dobzhanskii CBS 2104 TaxID=1427455 RepID=A0A0A8LBX9_9SACH|nr:unnamed protein product [Kluyveromyces dobzhanskii CBS 2104]
MAVRLPLGQIPSSKLNVLSQERELFPPGKRSMPTHLNTPSNSPSTEQCNSSDNSLISTLNSRTASTQVYCTPPNVLEDVKETIEHEVQKSDACSNKHVKLTDERILRLKSRVQLAYYKYRTNQEHLKFTEIVKHKRQMANKVRKLDDPKSRKLAGLKNAAFTATKPSTTSNLTVNPQRKDCITPEKRYPTKPYASTSAISSGYTPVSVKAAKSLLHMFSTGA